MFAIFLGNLEKLINKWKKSDLDIKIVSLFPPGLFIFLLVAIDLYDPKDRGYIPLVTIMIQLFAITLASAAAVIAFRNYRRKSGDGLFYVTTKKGSHIPLLILYNTKDKQAFIFAIDIELTSGERVRLVDFIQSMEPFNLSAFETKLLPLKPVFSYDGRDPVELNNKDIKDVICITPNGEIFARRLRVPPLNNDYIKENNIYRALRIQNKPTEYGTRALDLDAQYWVYISEKVRNRYEEYSSTHILTGFIVVDKFYLTNESFSYLENERNGIKAYCLNTFHGKKVEGSYREKSIRYEDGSYLINGLFFQEDWREDADYLGEFDICVLTQIDKMLIDNKHKST